MLYFKLTNPWNEYPALYNFAQTHRLYYSLEPSHLGESNEHSNLCWIENRITLNIGAT